MKTPKGLGTAGRALWRSVVSGIPDGCELDDREATTLELAARQADDLVLLEDVIEEEGAVTFGSTGQRVVHPAIGEARQARLAISRLLGTLDLSDEEGQGGTLSSLAARRAARSRWDRRRAS